MNADESNVVDIREAVVSKPLKPVFKDRLVTHTVIKFGWRDRLKILLGRPVTVGIGTNTEHRIGWFENEPSLTWVTVHPFRNRPLTLSHEGDRP